jgi:Ca2+/H+ antiporter
LLALPPADTFGSGAAKGPAVAAITVVLYAFCIVFAINSAIHSYLIVAYAEGDKASRSHQHHNLSPTRQLLAHVQHLI